MRSFKSLILPRRNGEKPLKNVSTDLNQYKLYSKQKPISKAKCKDLEDLCKSGVILPDYHHFYKSPPVCENERDALPEPNFDEDEREDETGSKKKGPVKKTKRTKTANVKTTKTVNKQAARKNKSKSTKGRGKGKSVVAKRTSSTTKNAYSN